MRTGSARLDRLLAGPGSLDVQVFPEISLRTQMLVQVPTSWTAVGQLQLKGIDLPGHRCDVVTTRLVPTLTQRIAMSCVIALELTP